jgi:hypothetical protein
VLTVFTCRRARWEVRTRTVAIAFTHRGVVTLGNYASDGEDGQDVEVEKGTTRCVDVLSILLTRRGVVTLGDHRYIP